METYYKRRLKVKHLEKERGVHKHGMGGRDPAREGKIDFETESYGEASANLFIAPARCNETLCDSPGGCEMREDPGMVRTTAVW
jgi:hypothetical protein